MQKLKWCGTNCTSSKDGDAPCAPCRWLLLMLCLTIIMGLALFVGYYIADVTPCWARSRTMQGATACETLLPLLLASPDTSDGT